METAAQVAVRWRDLDPLGHVNYAVYLSLLEEGRNVWIEQTFGGDLGADEYVVARVAIDFHCEVPSDVKEVTVKCRPVRIGRSSLTTLEQVLNAEGEVCAEAEVVIVLWDPAVRCKRLITDEERSQLMETREAVRDGRAH